MTDSSPDDGVNRSKLSHGREPTRREAARLLGAGLGLAAFGSAGLILPHRIARAAGDSIAQRALDGAAALKLSGKTIRIFHPAGMNSNFEPFVEQWRSATGIDVVASSVGYFDYHPKVVQSGITGGGDFDLIVDGPRYLGDLVAAGAILDLTDWIAKYKNVISGAPDGYLSPMDKWSMSYKGRYYALAADGDPWVCCVRSDLLGDPAEKAAFEKKYGYPLEFPKTWEQYRDQAEFFTRPDKNLYGAVDVHSRNSGAYLWMARYVSTKIPDAYYFDDDMHPLINSPEGIRTTELYLAMKPFMNPDIANWDYTQQYPSWANGEAYAINYVVSIKKFSEGGDSKVKGKVKVGLVPGTMVDGKLNQRSILAFGNSISVWAKSPIPEAAYLFAQWITSPEMSGHALQQPGYWDPFRIADIKNPLVRESYGDETMDIYAETMARQVPDMQLEGVAEYYDALDRNLSAAWAGEKTAADVVKETAAQWEEITDRIGRDRQVAQWRLVKAAYPVG
jgi:multiple sugar transport system substrate-binding protein